MTKNLRLRAKVTEVSPSIALLHEIFDHFGYAYESLSNVRRPRRLPPIPRHAIYYLKQKRYIRARKIGDRLEVCITREGERRVRYDRLYAVTKRLSEGWEVVVVFDFPESERVRRDLWRRFLKRLGMSYLQKSVWHTDRDLGEALAEMVRREGLEEWIHVLHARILTK